MAELVMIVAIGRSAGIMPARLVPLNRMGRADLPALDDTLDGQVRRVKAAHKTDRDQTPADRHFLLDDLPGHGGGSRQRFLAQHRLAAA